MTSTPGRVLIVGASLAGATTAFTLRDLGYDGQLTLLGSEVEIPYERPGLSKDYLLGKIAADRLHVRAPEDYTAARIELLTGRTATALDVDAGSVTLDDGSTASYDALVIATGASNVLPRIPGVELPGVHQLRTLGDSDALAKAAASGSAAVVVGSGFIGCEVSAALRTLGVDVTVVDVTPGPMFGPFGAHVSGLVRAWHEENGVRFVQGSVARISGTAHADGVETDDGTRLAADFVVVGVGVRPATQWLLEAPLHLDGGAVAVDGTGRTDVPGIWAAGDVAAVWDEPRKRHVRVEHWAAAVEQGKRVAHGVLGIDPPPAKAPFFWTQQYGHMLQYAGRHDSDAEVLPRSEGTTALYVADGAVQAVAVADNPKEFRRLRALLGSPPASFDS